MWKHTKNSFSILSLWKITSVLFSEFISGFLSVPPASFSITPLPQTSKKKTSSLLFKPFAKCSPSFVTYDLFRSHFFIHSDFSTPDLHRAHLLYPHRLDTLTAHPVPGPLFCLLTLLGEILVSCSCSFDPVPLCLHDWVSLSLPTIKRPHPATL